MERRPFGSRVTADPPNGRPKLPWPVKASAATWVLLALYGLVNFVLLVARTDWARYGAPAAHQVSVRGTEVPTSGPLVVVSVVLFYFLAVVLAVALPLWFSWAVVRGRRWARIAFGVYAVAEIAFTLIGGRVDTDSLVTLFQVLAAILLWLPSANGFFAEYRKYSRGRDAERALVRGLAKRAARLPQS